MLSLAAEHGARRALANRSGRPTSANTILRLQRKYVKTIY